MMKSVEVDDVEIQDNSHLYYINHDDNIVPNQAMEEKYDLCLVFKMAIVDNGYSNELSEESSLILDKLVHLLGRKHFHQFYSTDGSKRFVLIRGGISRLKPKAEQIGFKMKLDPETIKAFANKGDKLCNIDPFEILHDELITPVHPLDFIYGEYKCDPKLQNLYWRPDENNHPFRSSIRLQLLKMIIEDDESKDGAGFVLDELVNEGFIDDYFTLHNQELREMIRKNWMFDKFSLPWKQPLNDICDYWGQQIATMFAFKGKLTYWLLLPAFLGAGCQASLLYFNDFNISKSFDYSRPEVAILAIIISLFTILLPIYWDRAEKILYMQWGEYNISHENSSYYHDDDDNVLPTFKGKSIKSHITGRPIVYFDHSIQRTWYFLSISIISTVTITMMVIIMAIYVVRSQISLTSYLKDHQSILVSLLNAILIEILNNFFRSISNCMTGFENHRSEVTFENSLIAKNFTFQFITCFSSSYYLAFISLWVDPNNITNQCGFNHTCMDALSINILVILVFRTALRLFCKTIFPAFWRNPVGFFLPRSCRGNCIDYSYNLSYDDDNKGCLSNCYSSFCTSISNCFFGSLVSTLKFCCSKSCLRCWKKCTPCYVIEADLLICKCCGKLPYDNEEDEDDNLTVDTYTEEIILSNTEIDYNKKKNDHLKRSLDVYLDQIMLIGYVSLFVVALPGAPLIALIYNWASLKGDVFSLIHTYRKPIHLENSKGIGLWKDLFNLLSIFTTITNAAIVIFTLDLFINWSLSDKFLLFIGVQWFIFMLQYYLTISEPKLPEVVRIQKKRANFITKKLILKVADRPIDSVSAL